MIYRVLKTGRQACLFSCYVNIFSQAFGLQLFCMYFISSLVEGFTSVLMASLSCFVGQLSKNKKQVEHKSLLKNFLYPKK